MEKSVNIYGKTMKILWFNTFFHMISLSVNPMEMGGFIMIYHPFHVVECGFTKLVIANISHI